MNRCLRFLINSALISVVALALLPFPAGSIASAQKATLERDRSRGQIMLDRIREDLESHYYDPTFHGMDLDLRFKTAAERIKRAASVGEIFGIIAQAMVDLNDSHTYFIPPSRSTKTDYGWTMQIVGDRCFVASVDEDSDPALKGVKPGDEIVDAAGYKLERRNLWKFQYLYNVLRPTSALRVTLKTPTGEQRQLELLAKTKTGKKVVELTSGYIRKARKAGDSGRDQFKSFDDQLLIWKMNEFDLTDGEVDKAIARARKHQTLILDLRGNGGGLLHTTLRLLSYLVERDVKVADSVTRQEKIPVVVKARSEKNFTGRLIVLVDSRSASASEVFARVIQLEKRGVVVGDQTAGAVTASRRFVYEIATEDRTMIFFESSITVSDLIMSDGKSLEHHGVIPDEVRLPSPGDLAADRDVVLSYAASLAGVTADVTR